MNILNILGNLLVRIKKSIGIFGIDEADPRYYFPVVFIGRLICGLATGVSSFIVPLYSNL